MLPIRTLLHRQCECTTSSILQFAKLCTQPRRVRSQIPELLYCSLARRLDRTSAFVIPSSLIQHPVRPCADILSRGKLLANAHAASIEHAHRLCSFRRGSDQPRRHHFTTGYDLPAVENTCRTRALHTRITRARSLSPKIPKNTTIELNTQMTICKCKCKSTTANANAQINNRPMRETDNLGPEEFCRRDLPEKTKPCTLVFPPKFPRKCAFVRPDALESHDAADSAKSQI